MSICRECVFINAQKFYNHYMGAFDVIQSCTLDDQGLHHSFDDKPSMVYTIASGSVGAWHKNGKKHRDLGPAVTYRDDAGTGIYYYEDDYVPESKWNLYIGKTYIWGDSMALVFEKVNDIFYKVLNGDKIFLVASVSKT